MPFITRDSEQAVAGTNTLTLQKPTGDKIVITSISVRSKQENLFAGAACELSEKNHIYRAIALFGGTVTSSTGTSTNLFRGRQEWTAEYELNLYFITQNASDVLYYVVEYEIIPKEVTEPRWGA